MPIFIAVCIPWRKKRPAAYEDAREKIATFIHAKKAAEIIFTRNTTESINLVAQTWVKANLESGDLIILTEMEHHSNLVPWHMIASEKESETGIHSGL